MNFQWPPRQRHTTSQGHEYSFIHAPAGARRPTLLLLHGFPSQLHDWARQVAHFAPQGYGILAPDLLGYGETSKPSETSHYRLRLMSDDVVELLDSLQLPRVVGIGHDFGATLLSRAAAYYPDRWSALVFLSVGPPRMGTPFDVEVINTITKRALGYEILGYIPWLGADPDARNILEANAASAMSLVFCADASVWNEWYRPLGKMKQFVAENRRAETGEWYDRELQSRHLEAFGRDGGYKGAVQWYRMWMGNLFAPDEVGYEDFEISQPVLFVCDVSDGQQRQLLQDWAQDMTTVEMMTGHWVHLEQAKRTNDTIDKFLTRASHLA